MDPLKNTVQDFWNLVIATMQLLWISFAVIVFLHGKLGVFSTSEPVTHRKTEKGLDAYSKKTLRAAKKLMRLRRLEEASEMLHQATLNSADAVDSAESKTNKTKFLTAASLHELRSLCLYQQGNVVESMIEMDKGLGKLETVEVNLMNSANCCFQLFYKWCIENCEHSKEEIAKYFHDKKTRLAAAAFKKVASATLLLESVHCFILAEFLVKHGILNQMELPGVKDMCMVFFHLMTGEGRCTR